MSLTKTKTIKIFFFFSIKEIIIFHLQNLDLMADFLNIAGITLSSQSLDKTIPLYFKDSKKERRKKL